MLTASCYLHEQFVHLQFRWYLLELRAENHIEKKIEYTSKTILNCIMWKASGDKIYPTALLDLPKIFLMRRYGIATLINFCFLRIKLPELNFVWQTVLRLKLGCETFLSWFRFSFFWTPCVVYIVVHLVIWQEKKKNRKASFLALVCGVIEFYSVFFDFVWHRM